MSQVGTASLAALAAGSFVLAAHADDDRDRVRTRLSGFNEVHFVGGSAPALRGAVSTPASGSFRAQIDERRQILHYELSYRDLRGDVTQAHIHFGQKHSVGGIVVWLCQTAGTPAPAAVAAATPLCLPEGTVSGTIEPSQVLAQDPQGFPAGSFAELLRAIRAGATYVNVHSSVFGPGEIRGQLAHDHD